MFTVGFGPYQVLCLYDGLPALLDRYVNRAALTEGRAWISARILPRRGERRSGGALGDPDGPGRRGFASSRRRVRSIPFPPHPRREDAPVGAAGVAAGRHEVLGIGHPPLVVRDPRGAEVAQRHAALG